MSNGKYAIIGGGMVAGYAAKEMADRGVRPGDLAIVSADDALPYERPPLSKGFLAGTEDESSIYINDRSFYAEHGIEVRTGTTVRKVDLRRRELALSDGGAVRFEKLLIATGSRPRTFDLPGAGLEGIYYLRSLDDAKRIKNQADGASEAVVFGGGFIGMEVSSVLAQRGIKTTLIFPEQRVWERAFTPEISALFERYYEERGVVIRRGEAAAAFAGKERVESVSTTGGTALAADLVVAGIGVTPVVEPFREAGLQVDNGVVVNEFLETSAEDVFAAGDVANYRDVVFGKHRRVEHWDNAVEQGKHAAGALMGERRPFKHVPYFFSDVFDLSYEYWGDATDADDIIYRGDVTSTSFSAWWLRDGAVVAAFVMNRDDSEREAAPRWISERRGIDEGTFASTASA